MNEDLKQREVTVGMISPDKNWIVCDNTPTSPFYGNCYTEWDDNGDGNRIYMSTSTDGGLTWGAGKRTANNATGIGGQPVVQPNGTVIVPIDNANETALCGISFYGWRRNLERNHYHHDHL